MIFALEKIIFQKKIEYSLTLSQPPHFSFHPSHLRQVLFVTCSRIFVVFAVFIKKKSVNDTATLNRSALQFLKTVSHVCPLIFRKEMMFCKNIHTYIQIFTSVYFAHLLRFVCKEKYPFYIGSHKLTD